MDLQYHDLQNHDDAVKETIENITNKKVEKEKGYNPKCSKCWYILYSEDNDEEHFEPKLIFKVCPMLFKT